MTITPLLGPNGKIPILIRDDDTENIYYVKSVTTGEKYTVNKLKDNNHWFCTCKGYLYSAGNPKKCKHTQRIRVIDQLYKKYADKIKTFESEDR